MLSSKFFYIRKEENLKSIIQLRKPEKVEQFIPKTSRRKEMIKIKPEIDDMEKRKTVGKISKTKSCH